MKHLPWLRPQGLAEVQQSVTQLVAVHLVTISNSTVIFLMAAALSLVKPNRLFMLVFILLINFQGEILPPKVLF